MANSTRITRSRTHILPDDRAQTLSSELRHQNSTSTAGTRSRAASTSAAASTDSAVSTASTADSTATATPSTPSTSSTSSIPPVPTISLPTHAPLDISFLDPEEIPPPPPGSPPNIVQRPRALSDDAESFISIVDDPFFKQYQGSQLFTSIGFDVALALPSLSSKPPGSLISHNEPLLLEQQFVPGDSAATAGSDRVPLSDMEAVNIAVIGANGVGKSAFIQRALRLARPPTTNMTAIRLDVEGVPHIVALVELDLEYFDVNPNQKIHWPKQINGHMVPRIDGALILYDVMNKESIRELPHVLSALSLSSLPTMLVATKCDHPESIRQINAEGMATVFPTILADFKTSANVPASTRDCLQSMVLASVFNRRGSEKENSTRRRAASSAANLDTPTDNARSGTLSDRSSPKHNRASSDLSLIRGPLASSSDRESFYRGQSSSRAPRVEYPNTPQMASSNFGNEPNDDEPTENAQGTPHTTTNTGATFLDIDESDGYSEEIPILQRSEDGSEKSQAMTGTTFEELVDRLLSAPMSRADGNFADIFLCLYRKFASPSKLLSSILERLDTTRDDTEVHFLERTSTQFRMIEVIAQWVSLYPGDFARPSTRQLLEGLVKRLSDEPVYAVASQQLRDHLEQDVMADDDTEWACSDETPPNESGTVTDTGGDTTPTSTPQRESDSLPTNSLRTLQLDDSRSFEKLPSESGSNTSQFQFHSYEDYEREAATLMPLATLPLNKNRFHIFMAQSPDDMADEITRIDWIMFSSIRIRDLVRHVSLSLHEKEQCKSLANVNRMISHFNHVAKWVSNMILIRDKAKHRAQCLQRFMLVALRLRQLNNYNGLAAVLAGINGTAVHRLGQTRILVDMDVQKRFARLVLLMSTQKSHFAYRLAWENSPLPRIPFMPLHRRDLVSAEEGSRTFLGSHGDRINWKKFEVLGEVLLPVMKSQGTSYPNLKRNNVCRELIMDCRMPTDEEEIYQRSVQVEPQTGPVDSLKKKFPWLPK